MGDVKQIINQYGKFIALEDKDFVKTELETKIEYQERTDKIYRDSTHWLCENDEMATSLNVTPGKVYPLLLNPNHCTEDHNVTLPIYQRTSEGKVIIDDINEYSAAWFSLHGTMLIRC